MSVGGRAYGYNSEPVVDELWERVKARQREQSARVGARVKAGLTVGEARRTGRPPQYIFSGLCKCELCKSNFVVSGPSQSYVCATRAFGGLSACPNTERVPRVRLESGLLEAIKQKLLDPEYQQLFADEVRQLLSDDARHQDAEREARRARIARLTAGIENYANAIGTGLKSATLLERLAAAEAERARLVKEDEGGGPRDAKVVPFLPDLSARYERIVSDMERVLQTSCRRARSCAASWATCE